jgi:hypothetical protein
MEKSYYFVFQLNAIKQEIIKNINVSKYITFSINISITPDN